MQWLEAEVQVDAFAERGVCREQITPQPLLESPRFGVAEALPFCVWFRIAQK